MVRLPSLHTYFNMYVIVNLLVRTRYGPLYLVGLELGTHRIRNDLRSGRLLPL